MVSGLPKGYWNSYKEKYPEKYEERNRKMSNSLKGKYKKERIGVICGTCGKKIEIIKGHEKKFCSRECRWKALEKQRIERICKGCGNPFKAVGSSVKKYCSFNCYLKNMISPNKGKHFADRISMKCRNCNKGMLIRKNSADKFCSRDCYNDFIGKTHPWNYGLSKDTDKRLLEVSNKMNGRKMLKTMGENNPAKRMDVREKISATKSGEKNPNWKPFIEKLCRNCGNSFKTKKSGKEFCSGSCFMTYSNPMKSAAVAEKVGAAQKRLWENPEYKKQVLSLQTRKPNNLERAFESFIEKYGLPFEYVGNKSFWIGPCVSGKCRNPDFIHKDHKIKKAILVGSKYWHHDSSDVKREISDYKYKNWSVLWIWEDEFYENEAPVLDKIKSFIGIDMSCQQAAIQTR